MSLYRATIAENGNYIIYTDTINQELFDLLESVFNEECELDDYTLLKQIYVLLSDEVDDEDYYDLGVNEDNDDLIEILFEYCTTFIVDKSKLAVALGKYTTQPEVRHFESFRPTYTKLKR